eukprot:scaffold68538_cov29-Tisochrysis_lutea.AAC.1
MRESEHVLLPPASGSKQTLIPPDGEAAGLRVEETRKVGPPAGTRAPRASGVDGGGSHPSAEPQSISRPAKWRHW